MSILMWNSIARRFELLKLKHIVKSRGTEGLKRLILRFCVAIRLVDDSSKRIGALHAVDP